MTQIPLEVWSVGRFCSQSSEFDGVPATGNLRTKIEASPEHFCPQIIADRAWSHTYVAFEMSWGDKYPLRVEALFHPSPEPAQV